MTRDVGLPVARAIHTFGQEECGRATLACDLMATQIAAKPDSLFNLRNAKRVEDLAG
tara:strand:+ start:2086 stop:2256 length:171 start_codon:yes stop_codon:yes gene_type:complete